MDIRIKPSRSRIMLVVMIVTFLIACNQEGTNKEVHKDQPPREILSDSKHSEFDPIVKSLSDFTVGGSYIKLNVSWQDSSETILLDNPTLFNIYGMPRKMNEEQYFDLIYGIIKKKEALEVSSTEFERLSPSFIEERISENLVLEEVLTTYFENGKQIKLIPDEDAAINLLLDAEYRVWTDDFSGDLRIKSCD